MTEVLFSASMVVGFMAGVIALFAPCCITFLLPAYLGQIVASRTKIFLGTMIFSAGIATIMLPLAVGFKVILDLFWQYHTLVYYLGALLMVFFGLLTIGGKELMRSLPKLPILKLSDSKLELSSIYLLGIVSGLSSACCAPVLAGAIVLAGLSPNLIQTLLVGSSYVAGMVFPLFVGALFLESNLLQPVRQFLNKKTGSYSLGNLISGLIFIVMGAWIGILNYQGRIAMGSSSQKINQMVGSLNVMVGSFLSQYKVLDWVLGLIVLVVFVYIIRLGRKKDQQ